jgi:trimethylamine--corrinoid protein Co-methyltransferase
MLHTRTELLTSDDLALIHRTSMQLLTTVGVDFAHPEALAIFQRHGVRTEGSRVYLREDQVMDAIQGVPAQFTIQARDPARSVTLGDGEPVFAPGYGAPFLVDSELGKRAPTMDDYQNLVRLAHALPHQDLSGHLMVHPGDIVAQTAHLHMLQANMIHSDKPFMGSTEGTLGARRTMEMASILFDRDVQGWPVTIGLINSLSPLGYGTEMLEALIEYARWRQPVVVAALAMAGLTAPITLAGELAMQNAELLAGVVLTQLVSPGTPVIYGSASTNMDMRTGALAIGSPELAILVACHAQLARHYGLPSRSGGSLTDASSPDAQAGFESMFGLLTAVTSDIDLVLHAAGILSSFMAFSYEKLILDDEMCGMVRRFRRGIVVEPDTLAYDVVAHAWPGGNFLTEDHTVARCRTEFWEPAVSDRDGLEAWMIGGQQDALVRARRRWQRLLAEHEDPPLDESVRRRLNEYVQEYAA